ncbi:hypothetical protein [Streptomyces sp. NPDC006463]|uniref:hypothetical protein n=1 Tax=Streptomyces sp. NPDC006463 TaxID=3364746 RepID=UPI0036C96D10
MRLVTTPGRRRDLDKINALSARLGKMATARYVEGPEGVDLKKTGAEFDEVTERQQAALQTFMDRSADEAL